MTITYHKPFADSMIEVPKLYRVVYAHTTDDVLAVYQHSFKDLLVSEWLREHCKHKYYHHPGWSREKFIEFECSEDAVLFALVWS